MDINEKNTPPVSGSADAPRPKGKHHGRGRNRRGRGRGGNRPQNEAAAAPEKQSAPTAEASQPRGEQKKSDKQANAPAERRGAPATGRPQRTIHHGGMQTADLPDMENLLIEDAMKAPAAPAAAKDAPDASEIERILERDIFERPDESIPEYLPAGKIVIVGVRFRTGGKTYFFDPGRLTCKAGQYAVVETARGQEFGEIYIGNRLIDESLVVPPLRPVVRLATEADIAHNEENHKREEAAFRIGVEKIREHKLDMKLVAAQYTFDNAKLLFYFTSAGRVDFRELVKDLAGVFHIRIELRQIGIRDEARMIGGLGACGRPLCCTTFLSDFGQVSMKMAKEQNLSLNSTKISGCCGRLMCCLRYEHETYAEETRRTPAPGTFVNTPDGPGVVTEMFPLRGEIKVSLKGQPDAAPKKYSRDAVEVIARGDKSAPRKDEDTAEPDSDE